jgi:cyclic pyranopterin phosphate synthase
MSAREVLEAVRDGRRRGGRYLWLGGGEPTLRRDLFKTIQYARHIGYERVKLQTNGMLLADPDFVDRSVEAGLTDVSFSIKGSTAETHDRLTRTPGCYEAMIEAIRHCASRPLELEADILCYRSNIDELPDMVAGYHTLGIQRFSLWLLSLFDQRGENLAHEVPKIADLMALIVTCMDLCLSDRADFITSLHTPLCTVPATHTGCTFSATDLSLQVVEPGGRWFWLEESPIEGGHFLDPCEQCSARSNCGGLRRDYLDVHGSNEFRPILA